MIQLLLQAFLSIILISSSLLAAAEQEMSELAELADQSLLLDITHAGNRLVAVGERGHVLLSDDKGASWRQVSVPTRSQLTAVTFADDQNGWAVGHDAIILHTRDGGEHWSLQHRDEQYDDPLLDVWFKNQDHGFAVGAYGMFLSTNNGGESWDRRQISEDDFHLNAIAALPDGELLMAAEQGHIYHSEDDGYNWSELPSPYGGSWFGIAATGEDDLIVFGLRGHLFRSSDRGRHWCEVETGTEASLMAAARLSDDTLILVGLGGTVLTSRDNARTFTVRTRKDRKSLTGILAVNNDELILSGAAGISRDTAQQ
jgi:photosystem II stability/assembly factor-like uncharacterized protein